MRGLLSFYRGLHTLSNRQARRKAGIVGSRCGFCGTQSNSKVRFERVTAPRLSQTNDVIDKARFSSFVLDFVTMYQIDVAYKCCMQLSQMWMRWQG